MKTPLVSIITPSYNQAKFLEQTIQSVLNQSYANIEYIIMDGGSNDGSREIIEKYHSQLKYWESQKDNGQSHAINKGLEKSSGELFCYLNSDDLLEPYAVQEVVDVFLKNPDYALYYGKCSTIDENNNLIHEAQGAEIHFKKLLNGTMLPYIFQPASFFNPNKIDCNPVFDNSLNFCMDYDLILYLMKKHPICFIDKNFAKYRVHNQAKTTARADDMYVEKLKVVRKHSSAFNPFWLWRMLKLKAKTLI